MNTWLANCPNCKLPRQPTGVAWSYCGPLCKCEWNRRAPAQPEPAAPTPDTFMGEPVLTRWKPLNRDDSRLALHQSMHNRSFGNPSDDKLMLEWLWENGYALCKRVPDEAAPTPQQQALDRMVENAETLGLYEAAPTEATLDQMAGKAWDRFQRHTAELQALENCRLYAARHRKEDWAATILRFCAEGGATGSPLRVLMSAPMVRAILAGTKTRKLYAPAGTSPNDPEHLSKRLVNGIAAAPDDGCWQWNRITNSEGYGQLRIAGRTVYAHRLAYQLWVGEIPEGMHILHSCDNPPCINPSHLSVGTRSDNMKECSERGRARIPKPIKRGEDNGASKLKEVDVRSIRRLIDKGLTQQSIADRFGVTQRTISDIKLGKKWGHTK